MHVELFCGLYAHLLAFLLERGRQGVDVEVRTDQVDTPIVQRFTEVAKELLNHDPNIVTASGFDTIEKKVCYWFRHDYCEMATRARFVTAGE